MRHLINKSPPLNCLLFCLFVIAAMGCEPHPPQTVVTLHHVDPSTLISTLEKSLGSDTRFSIVKNKIIIFAEIKSVAPTLELLESLDTSLSIVSLQFKRLKQYDYSTIESPEPFLLKENIHSRVIVNNEIIYMSFKRITESSFEFKMATRINSKTNKIVFEIKEGVWKRVYLKGLESFPLVKVMRRN